MKYMTPRVVVSRFQQDVTLEERELQKYPAPFGADQIPDFVREESQKIEGEIEDKIKAAISEFAGTFA